MNSIGVAAQPSHLPPSGNQSGETVRVVIRCSSDCVPVERKPRDPSDAWQKSIILRIHRSDSMHVLTKPLALPASDMVQAVST